MKCWEIIADNLSKVVSVWRPNRLFPVPIVNDYGSNVPILIGFGALALVLVALTRGRLGYQRYREEVPDPATAPT